MIVKSPKLLVVGGLLFLLGSILLFLWLAEGPGILLVLGVGLLPVSALTLALGGRSRGEDPANPLEARRERKLWTSGPLGRRWLDRRNRLP